MNDVILNPTAVIAWARAAGSDATTVRDAAHEGFHAWSLGVEPPWDREVIHQAVMQQRPGDRVLQEVHARAAEWLASEAAGEAYDLNRWAGLAAMEAIKSDVSMPYKYWVEAIINGREAIVVQNYLLMLVEESSNV